MNKTKLIYFLSAFVLIIGCFALNQSYSMFVQTETINNVNSIVPTLAYSIGDNNLNLEKIIIKANSDELVKIKINNTGTTNIKYVLSLVEKIDGVDVQLVKLDKNDLIGSLTSENSKYIWFKIKNSNLEDKEITFSLTATYYTLNIDDEELISKTNIDLENLYELDLKNNIVINSVNASIDKTLENKSMYIEDITLLNNENNKGLLLTMDDDYTETTGNMSYYFNGNVLDNYVNFANMCWRIVRVEGDNSIKLILEDIDNTCEASNGNYSISYKKIINEDSNDEINTAYIVETEEVLYNGTYGYKINADEQVISDYLDSEVTIGSMVNSFKEFQVSLNDYISYMKIGNWCLDNNLYEEVEEDNNVTYNLVQDLNTNYTNWKKMYYGTYTNIKNNELVLKCDGTIINKYSDNTDMYVSTLTASEAYLSGLNEIEENKSNYLMNNYSTLKIENDNTYKGINFWTLSPSHFDGLRSYAYGVSSNGSLISVDLLDNNMTFRPSIIINNTNIIRGDGTKTNPYTVTEEQSVD